MRALIAIIFVILIILFIYYCCGNEYFSIEPNTIMGGYTNPDYTSFELEGPGNAAWSGY